MVIADSPDASPRAFQRLMSETDQWLNRDASRRPGYYRTRGGERLEEDVAAALRARAKGTAFDGTIRLVSGHSFPDIIARRIYGVEVKSTLADKWTSIGSSILETTRDADVSRIYLTFGKLADPVGFVSRPYEDCMVDILVTHYPRYKIDMECREGETIFDKLDIPYDTLRVMDNPVKPVAEYYKRRLRPGESLWWAGDATEDMASPPIIRVWSSLPAWEKERLVVEGYALFPELLRKSADKYNGFTVWLVTRKSVVNPNVRDSFSAGGKVTLPAKGLGMVSMPAAYGRIARRAGLIRETLNRAGQALLEEYWGVPVRSKPLDQWRELVARSAMSDSSVGYNKAKAVLEEIFRV